MAAGKKNGGGGGFSLIFRFTLLVCLGLTLLLLHCVEGNSDNYKGGQRCANGKNPQTKDEYEENKKDSAYTADKNEESGAHNHSSSCASKNCTYNPTVGQAVCTFPNFENGLVCKNGQKPFYISDTWGLTVNNNRDISQVNYLVDEATRSAKDDGDNCKSGLCFYAGRNYAGEAVCKENETPTTSPAPGGEGSSSAQLPNQFPASFSLSCTLDFPFVNLSAKSFHYPQGLLVSTT